MPIVEYREGTDCGDERMRRGPWSWSACAGARLPALSGRGSSPYASKVTWKSNCASCDAAPCSISRRCMGWPAGKFSCKSIWWISPTSFSTLPRKYWWMCCSDLGLARSMTSSSNVSPGWPTSNVMAGVFHIGFASIGTVEVTFSGPSPTLIMTQALGLPRRPLPSSYIKSMAPLIQTLRMPMASGRPVTPSRSGASEKEGSRLSRARCSGRCRRCSCAPSGPLPGNQPKKASFCHFFSVATCPVA
mmetsp:Transcript_20199/g.56360  ORF Transcript_20199/g.56360 Transcript_20199/m.56360 type:complete len:246 (-) Transcript_20199:2559-3296(-)